MSTLQRQARALGDPTRHHIFRAIADGHDVDVAGLTAQLGITHNAVRQHLAKLVDAGLVTESTLPTGSRGRPKLIYRVAPAVESRWGVVGPYERLSGLLAEIIRTGDPAREVGRRAGAAGTDAASPGDPVTVLTERMAGEGFAPTVRRDGDHAELTLTECPFASAVDVAATTVCDLHRGLADGVADRVDGLVIDELIPRDPHAAHCTLRCHVGH